MMQLPPFEVKQLKDQKESATSEGNRPTRPPPLAVPNSMCNSDLLALKLPSSVKEQRAGEAEVESFQRLAAVINSLKLPAPTLTLREVVYAEMAAEGSDLRSRALSRIKQIVSNAPVVGRQRRKTQPLDYNAVLALHDQKKKTVEKTAPIAGSQARTQPLDHSAVLALHDKKKPKQRSPRPARKRRASPAKAAAATLPSTKPKETAPSKARKRATLKPPPAVKPAPVARVLSNKSGTPITQPSAAPTGSTSAIGGNKNSTESRILPVTITPQYEQSPSNIQQQPHTSGGYGAMLESRTPSCALPQSRTLPAPARILLPPTPSPSPEEKPLTEGPLRRSSRQRNRQSIQKEPWDDWDSTEHLRILEDMSAKVDEFLALRIFVFGQCVNGITSDSLQVPAGSVSR